MFLCIFQKRNKPSTLFDFSFPKRRDQQFSPFYYFPLISFFRLNFHFLIHDLYSIFIKLTTPLFLSFKCRSMMITLSFLVVGLCFFLHRKFKKDPGAVALHTLPWTDENLEVFTLSGQVGIHT